MSISKLLSETQSVTEPNSSDSATIVWEENSPLGSKNEQEQQRVDLDQPLK